MALSQKHRSSIYTRLEPILGEEEAEALLSQFPSRELDEPVTKEFVRAEVQSLRVDMHDRLADMNDRLRSQTAWTASALFGGLSIAAAIGTFLR